MHKYFFSPILIILFHLTATSQVNRPFVSCAGTPAAGITISNRPQACSTDSVRLTVINSPQLEGLSYQWQSSADSSNWQDIPGDTSAASTVLQNTTHFYRRTSSCSGNAAWSLPVKVNSSPCYCKPAASGCNAGEYIKSISIGNLYNISACSPGGYSDYSDSIAVAGLQPPGLSVGILLGPGTGNTAYIALWIDLDHNGVFDPAEYYYIGGTTTTLGANSYFGNIVNLPLTSPGLTKMRVRVRAYATLANTDACTAYNIGETEDYLVNILPYNFCSGTPLQDTAYASVAFTCAYEDSVYLFTTSQNLGYNNFTYQWQKSTDSINWQSSFGSGAIGFDYVTTTTYFRRRISCGINSNYSVPVKVSTRCYCKPAASICSTGVVINKVTLNGTPYNSACGYNGYSYFGAGTSTSQVQAIPSGTDIPISVQAGCAGAGPQYVGVWADINMNGVFEQTEFTSLGTVCGNTVSGHITIPSNAAGETKIRVRISTDSNFNAASSCSSFSLGETEDYRVKILPSACPVYTWTGLGADEQWENGANWSCNQVPGATAAVVINSGNVTINSNVTVYSLTAGTTATITVTPPFNLVITH
jgi:hypothetical protein